MGLIPKVSEKLNVYIVAYFRNDAEICNYWGSIGISL